MKLRPFRLEHYYANYEFTAKYMLSSSDCESRSVSELLALEPSARERFDALWLGYTETHGAPYFRETIAGTYDGLNKDDVLVLASAQEGIFIAYHTLVGPGDHVIVEKPCFESAFEAARSTGADVSEWTRHFEDGWAYDLTALEGLIRPNTKVIYINTPHNPTGSNMTRATFDAVIDLARARGIYVFSDELFRGLELESQHRLPAACEVYDKAISLGSMSKVYGLAGLRLGWFATRDHEFLKRALDLKLYTTICSSAPSEFLSDLALRHRQVLVERNTGLLQRNLPVLEAFFERHSNLFSWIKPTASPMCFPKLTLPDAYAFCEEVVRDISVLLVPGDVYDQPGHVRFGFGRANMPEALELLETYLDGRGF